MVVFNRHNGTGQPTCPLLIILSINLDTMPVKASNSSNHSCSTAYRGIEYRLLPGTQYKAMLLHGLVGACLFVWNVILKQINSEFKHEDMENPSLSFYSLIKRYPSLRKETGWLSKYSSHIVRYTLKGQAEAWQAFFKGLRDHPTFHNKYKHKSFTAPKSAFTIVDDNIYIQKVGWMKMRRKGGNPYPDAEPIEVTVKKEGRYWKMSVLYKVNLPEQVDDGKAIGIDLNTYNIAYSSSDGERGMCSLPDLTDKEIRIRRYQRKLARQQKGSGRFKRTKRKINKWKRKQKNCRVNAAHQNSRALSNKAYTLKREDLKIKNMSKSAKGTIEDPGKNVKAKAGLNRVIQNAGWSRFNFYCDYKFGNVVLVDPKFTSQRCNQCGHTSKKNRKTQSRFQCMSCGHTDHADLNASANILLAFGIGASARGGAFSLETPMSREMDTQTVAV